MKNQITSKIATIVYKQYTENVDMNNPLFKQSELNNLVKSDKDIIRVDYYINGTLVGNKMHTPKQAAIQILKMNTTAAKIQDKFRKEYGSDWYENTMYNKTRQAEIDAISTKIQQYSLFLTEDVYNEMLACDMCCDFEDFIN